MMKIRTSNTGAMDVEYAWSAVDDDTYDGTDDSANRNMIGYGKTEVEAIEDLMRLLQEEAEWQEHQKTERTLP